MCLATNIARRAGSASYYARLAVPKELREVMGKRELWQSLGTKDAREAKARVAAVLARWHDEFAELRRRRDARSATEDDLKAATWEHYTAELEHHHAERQALPNSAEVETARQDAERRVRAGEANGDPFSFVGIVADALVLRNSADHTREARAVRKATLEKHLSRGETALVEGWARDLIRCEAWAIEPGTPAFRDLCQRFQRAELEALRRAEEQDRGDYTGRPADPVVQAPRKVAVPVAAPGEGVMELYEVFAKENPKGVKADTIRMNREIITWFSQHVGRTFPASAIDKRAVREWKTALAKFPIKAAEVREFRGLSFRKIIAENERLGRPTLSDRTVNKYLSALGAYCQWLMQNGHFDANPVDGMSLGKAKGQGKVRPYTPAQLSAIFASPLFTACQSIAVAHRPGNVQVRDHRYWLPLLSLFTGARMGELAQLLTADVRQEQGRWIIHVTREGDAAKTTKTRGSQRVIPVHPELERLGFLKHHARSVAAGDHRLFPEIEPDTRGTLAGNYSRWYARYVERIGVKADASVNFHSFRHGMADALRRAGFRDEEFAPLLGHTSATTTGRYGILSEGDLATRCRMIDAVKFPELDLSNLY